MTAKSLLIEQHQHHPLYHKRRYTHRGTARWALLWTDPEGHSLHPCTSWSQARRWAPNNTSLCKVQAKDLPIKGGMGVWTWLSVATLEITAQTEPSSSFFLYSMKIPRIISYCILNQPRQHGEKTGIPYQHGKKRNSAPPNTNFSTRHGSWKNWDRDPYCCLFQHFLCSGQYTSGIYKIHS